MSNVERRSFQMHRNLLRDTIRKQAGSLDKAILELVMNVVDAGATEASIRLNSTTLTVTDNGPGFQTRQEIIDAFETFGKSDERAASQHLRYGKFQMGRGQAMNFGRTTYRTRTFAMNVDIENDPTLGYELQEHLPDVPGCTVTVEMYRSLDEYRITQIERDTARNIRYVEIPVSYNGVVITKHPATESWTHITDDAYIRINSATSSVQVYNCGVHVETTDLHGEGGIIVSRKQLDVNFARNQVQRSCKIWQRLEEFFRKKTEKLILEKKSFNVKSANAVISRTAAGEFDTQQIVDLKLFADTNSKKYSLRELAEAPLLTQDQSGSVKADHAMQQKRGIVLNEEWLRAALGYDYDGRLLALIRQAFPGQALPKWVPRKTMYEGIEHHHSFLPVSEQTKRETIALDVLRATFVGWRNNTTLHSIGQPWRELRVGVTTAPWLAWTDGTTYIAIERSYLSRCLDGLDEWIDLLSTLAHEYAHSSEERTHDEGFYERYHTLVDAFLRHTTESFRSLKRKLDSAKILRGAKKISRAAVLLPDEDESSVSDDDVDANAIAAAS